MRRLGLVLQRILAVIAGYAAASLAASAGLHLALFATGGFDPAMLPLMAAGSFLFSIPFVALFVFYAALAPALAVIVLAELFGLRRASAYALLGGLVGGAICLLIWRAGQPSPSLAPPDGADGPLTFGLALAFVGSGAAGGLAYWLVAGRFARGLGRPGVPAAG